MRAIPFKVSQDRHPQPFGLAEPPFRNTPDPRFLYLSRTHGKARAYMQAVVEFTSGFAAISGAPGSGKTAVIESFLQDLPPEVRLVQLQQTQPQISAAGFLQAALVQLGFSPFRMRSAELRATLDGFLADQQAAGRPVLLAVDGAENLSARVLEEIRDLYERSVHCRWTLRILLAGRTVLDENLERMSHRSRIRLRTHLVPLTSAETDEYIRHRLQVAGSQGRTIFAEESVLEVFRRTGGVPRFINVLCDASLRESFEAGRDRIALTDVETAAAELGWPDVAGRAAPPEAAAPAQAPVVGRLVLRRGEQVIRELPLQAGRLFIGSAADNDLQIDARSIDLHHCHLLVGEDSCFIEDLVSRGGLFVQGRRVFGHQLQDGGTVQLGSFELRFHRA